MAYRDRGRKIPPTPQTKRWAAWSSAGVMRKFLLIIWLSAAQSAAFPKKVLVCGAGGRVGRHVVSNLLAEENVTTVRAFVRDAQDMPQHPKLEVFKGNLGNAEEVKKACDGMEAAVWCASGFSDRSSLLNRVKGLFGVVVRPDNSIDVKGLSVLGEAMKEQDSSSESGLPKVVLCSSAGVTRPAWEAEKQERLKGAAGIPIVRLNPFNILDTKRRGEEALRSTGVPYAIVRPTGLNDKWPEGRPIFSQGDVAVGRISRKDAAFVLTKVLGEKHATGKTFEVMALNSYPKAASMSKTLENLVHDTGSIGPSISEEDVETNYRLLQQLLPGERQEADALAMGQTYEQLDQGREGRLGKRGEERVPIVQEG